MKRHYLINAALILSGLILSSIGYAAGLMQPTSSSLPPLEIKEHHVNVIIEDGYVVTSVDQTFYNPNSVDLEAIYSFPIPEKAAVAELTYWIDGKATTGEVIEKKAARALYEEEKNAGRETAIVEQDDYRTFDISVSPVRAQQDVRIKLRYIQSAHVDTAIGRYVYPLEQGGVDEQKMSFWTYDESVKEKFSFTLLFRSSYPLDQLRMPNYPQAAITQVSEKEWSVAITNDAAIVTEEGPTPTLAPTIVQNLDKDIIVYWRHKQGLPGSVDVITYKEEGKGRGTFMMTLTPGDDLGAITEGRDWIFVLDYSGSMQGKYQSMLDGVSKGLHTLRPEDRFRLMIFNDSAKELTKGFETASPQNVQKWISKLESKKPGGSTNLYDGLRIATRTLDADRSSAIILITDGVANVGITEKKEFLNLMEQNDIRLFTFVMGNSANRPLLEGMVGVSNGFAISVSNSDDIVGKLMEATSKLTHEAMHDIELKFEGVKVRELSPEKINSLYRGQQLIVFGHYWGEGQVKLTLKGKVSGKDKHYSTGFTFPNNNLLHPEIERLWAYASIENLQNKMDYFGQDADTEQAITDIATQYSLVTNYTSMVVLRDEVFQQKNIKRNNATRVEKEQLAQQQRQATRVKNNRVDTHQPMYLRPASNHGGGGAGGGAMGPWLVLLLIPLLAQGFRRKNKNQGHA